MLKRSVAAAFLLGAFHAGFSRAQTDTKADQKIALSPTLQKIRQSATITLSHREGSFPFSYVDNKKQPIGYAMDLCMRVVDALRREMKMPNLRVDYLQIVSGERIQVISQGKADIDCGATTNNAERRKQVSFSVTHFYSGSRLLVRKDSKITDLVDFRGQTLVTTKGSSQDTFIKERTANRTLNANVVLTETSAQAFEMVQTGKAEGFLFDEIVLYAFRARSANPSELKIVGNPSSIEPLSLILRRDDPEFKRFVDTVVSRVMIDGEIQSIYRKWFLSPIPSPPSTVPVTLDMPMSILLRDQIRFPTDKVGDGVDG